MIYAIKGKIAEKKNTEIIIETAGIYYQIFVSLSTIEKLPEIGNEIFLYTIFIVREDSQTLYGFNDSKEKDLFKLLIDIQNIGPKTALGILSATKPDDLYRYISEGNLGMLSKLPGIGKKTAERLHVELKDKIDKFVVGNSDGSIESSNLNNEALAALITLGFNRSIAMKAVNNAMQESKNANVEDIIKIALKNVMK